MSTWHRELAEDIRNHFARSWPHDGTPDPLLAIIANRCPHQAQNVDSRESLAREICDALKQRGFYAPANHNGPDVIMAVARCATQHATTVRLLERALSHTMSTEIGRAIIQADIRAHLSALRQEGAAK